MMVYRLVILGTILLASTVQARAETPDAYTFKGACSSGALTSHPLDYGTISESDGVQVMPSSGMMSTRDYSALMKRAKAAHLTLGSDGFLWATRPIPCKSAIVWVKANSNPKGDMLLSLSNDDPGKPALSFTGVPVDGNGPFFFPDALYLGDGKPAMQLNPNGNGQGCHFYFTDHGAFTLGWENRLTTIECDLRVKTETGHLIYASVRFDVTQAPD